MPGVIASRNLLLPIRTVGEPPEKDRSTEDNETVVSIQHCQLARAAPTFGLPVRAVRQFWSIDRAEPTGPYWELTFWIRLRNRPSAT